ncbi:glycosyltransferase [Nocardia harenae]|uniref:glycosyltransferase n=1 Tax=Nocardia harenae TaxID=358707 RepID=UPI0008323A6E|nr:glycosyltransferase family 2 protein [Nocardia harenae]
MVFRAAARAGAALAGLSALLAGYNLLTVRRLPPPGAAVLEPVTVCIPARDEVTLLPRLVTDLRAQTGVPRLRVLILDDASTDGTEEAARRAAKGDPRITVLRSDREPPPGWTGKAAACARLAELADTPVLVFLDADVRLAPGAIAAAVTALRADGLGLLSPWPHQLAGSCYEALLQPLLVWSWASTLPVRFAERGLRTSTALGCGQFLVMDAAAYRAAGGHEVVAASATEDIDLARALRRAGHRTAVAAAGPHARTRMYRDAAALDAGYTRWLWSAYGGSPAAALAVGALTTLTYTVPPLAALVGRGSLRRTGAIGYAAAVTGRLLARTLDTGTRPHPTDILSALAHPLAVTAYLRLTLRSHRARARNELSWKNRATPSG